METRVEDVTQLYTKLPQISEQNLDYLKVK